MELVDNDNFYIGISYKDLVKIHSNGNNLAVLASDGNAFNVLDKLVNGNPPDQNDKAHRYRLGNGVYFVHDLFLFARRYSIDKAKRDSCDETILKVSLQKIFKDPDIIILNLLSEDGHFLFFKISKFIQNTIEKAFKGVNGALAKDFNFDSIVIDYLLFETENKNSFKIGGVAAIIQEPFRTEAYTNRLFNSSDLKNSNPNRIITGVRPLDHLEVMIVKHHCNMIDIIDVYDQNKIEERVNVYGDEFVQYFGASQ